MYFYGPRDLARVVVLEILGVCLVLVLLTFWSHWQELCSRFNRIFPCGTGLNRNTARILLTDACFSSSFSGFGTGINIDYRQTAQCLFLPRRCQLDQGRSELDHTGRRQQRHNFRDSPCETKQPASCSEEPGRSFWLQLCLERPPQSWDTERAARGDACTRSHTDPRTVW